MGLERQLETEKRHRERTDRRIMVLGVLIGLSYVGIYQETRYQDRSQETEERLEKTPPWYVERLHMEMRLRMERETDLFMERYDLNKDGLIDKDENQKYQEYLQQTLGLRKSIRPYM